MMLGNTPQVSSNLRRAQANKSNQVRRKFGNSKGKVSNSELVEWRGDVDVVGVALRSAHAQLHAKIPRSD